MAETAPDASAVAPPMPDFGHPRRGAHHTLDTALRALRRLDVEDARVVVESAGPGWAPGTVVRQEPDAGTPLGPRVRVVLGVSGIGALESLPYALRDVDDSAFGVDPLLALFDNPVYKLRHHLRGGGEFFALHTGDPTVARRWIEYVFQLDASEWPADRWFAVARLLTVLHQDAGREAGLRVALSLVCGLPLAGTRLVRALVPVVQTGRLALGRANARLGVDSVLGEGLAESARLEVAIGPVPLGEFLRHDATSERLLRRRLYALVLPAHLADAVDERWTVGDPDAPTRLTDAGARLTLGRAGGDAAPALGLTTRLAAMPNGAS